MSFLLVNFKSFHIKDPLNDAVYTAYHIWFFPGSPIRRCVTFKSLWDPWPKYWYICSDEITKKLQYFGLFSTNTHLIQFYLFCPHYYPTIPNNWSLTVICPLPVLLVCTVHLVQFSAHFACACICPATQIVHLGAKTWQQQLFYYLKCLTC